MPKYEKLKLVNASLVLDDDAEMVAPTETRVCDVCAARKRSGTMILYRNRFLRPDEEMRRSAWKCEKCGYAYPGPWGPKGPAKIRLDKLRLAYEKRKAARKCLIIRRLKRVVFGNVFAAGHP